MISATVTGNVGRQPEAKTTRSGKQMTTFSVASTYKTKDQQDGQTTWVDVVCFDEQADVVAQGVQKGDRVVVTGRLSLETYQKNDGTQGFSVRLVADEVAKSMRWAPRRQTVPADDTEDMQPF
jgi:single-strand DNA-binding protein